MSCRKSKVLMVVYVYIKEMLGLALVSGQLKVFCIRVSHFMGVSCAFPFYLYLLAPLRRARLKTGQSRLSVDVRATIRPLIACFGDCIFQCYRDGILLVFLLVIQQF